MRTAGARCAAAAADSCALLVTPSVVFSSGARRRGAAPPPQLQPPRPPPAAAAAAGPAAGRLLAPQHAAGPLPRRPRRGSRTCGGQRRGISLRATVPLQAAAVFRRYASSPDSQVLTFPEFVRLVRDTGVGGGDVAESQMRQLFDHVDRDGNGTIEIEEFAAWWPEVTRSYDAAASPIEAYDVLVESGEVTDDPRQRRALQELQKIWEALRNRAPQAPAQPKGGGGFFSRFFGGADAEPAAQEQIPGLYIHGGVGCGKSMVMDLFYEKATVKRKRRVHFHSFMLEIHARIHEIKRENSKRDGVSEIVEELSRSVELLCFDEFQVTDVGDAMILRRLFSALWAKGLVVIATSNRAPDNLYEGGINREVFLPFIPLLKKHCKVHEMEDGTDYRRAGEKVTDNTVYFTPLNAQASKSLFRVIKQLCASELHPETINVLGREVRCKGAADGLCHFTFDELCGQPLGPADYGAIARQYHTVCVSEVPRMTLNQRTEARRFITLIDELYEKRCRVLITAAAPPDALFGGDHGMESMLGGLSTADLEAADALKIEDASKSSLFSGSDEIFAMGRTVSRLNEMQTKEYLVEEKHAVLEVPERIKKWASSLNLA